MPIAALSLFPLVLAAAISDVRARRVSNRLNLTILLAGLGWRAATAVSAGDAMHLASAAGGIGVGLGAALVIMASAAWVDWTGAITGLGAAALGLFVFPSRRRKAKNELGERLEAMRAELIGTLRDHFEREMRRGAQRIGDTVAPFSRFVRAEREKIEGQRTALIELEAHIEGLTKQVEVV